MRLLLIPLIPIFVMCAKVLVEDWGGRYKARQDRKEQERRASVKANEPPSKQYKHSWDNDE